MRTGRSILQRLRSEGGAELIEMMVVTPLLLFLFAAIFDFAVLFRGWEAVTNAAREGARVASLPAYTADEDVRMRVQQYMSASGLASSCTIGTISGTTCPVPSTARACSVCVKAQPDQPGPGGSTYDARSVTVKFNTELPALRGAATLFGGSWGLVSVASTSMMRTEAPLP